MLTPPLPMPGPCGYWFTNQWRFSAHVTTGAEPDTLHCACIQAVSPGRLTFPNPTCSHDGSSSLAPAIASPQGHVLETMALRAGRQRASSEAEIPPVTKMLLFYWAGPRQTDRKAVTWISVSSSCSVANQIRGDLVTIHYLQPCD